MPKSLNPLPAAASRFINHLVSQAPWAQDSLRAHGGKTALFDIGAVLLRLQVTADGLVAPAVPDVADTASDAPQSAPDVTIALRAADLPLIAANPDRAVSYVKISGDADFANTISALSRGLRWDAGLDLSKFFGEIAAHRMVAAAEALKASALATHKSIAENVAEYFLEEQPMLVRPAAVAEQGSAIGRLRDDVERFAKRLEKLEGKRS